MKCIELSIKELEEQCNKWVSDISNDYKPELIVFVAKAGYIIGKTFAEYYDVDLIGIAAERNGGGIKSSLGKIMKHIPNFVRNLAIYIELRSGIHNKKSERNVAWIDSPDSYLGNVKNILIVDDSVDTGHSIYLVKKKVEETFGDGVDVKVAGLNVWDKSERCITTDFFMHRNTIILAPMSKDSKYYEQFVKMYNER